MTPHSHRLPVWAGLKCVHYPFVLKDIPRFAAITLVAPRVRFSALAIFLTPCLSLAIDFNVRKSSFGPCATNYFFLLRHIGSFFENRAFIMARSVSNAAPNNWQVKL